MKKFDVAKFEVYVSKITSKRRLNRTLCWVQKRIDEYGKTLELKKAQKIIITRIEFVRQLNNNWQRNSGGYHDFRHSVLSGVNLP